MWVWQHCIESIHAPCDPTSWPDLLEIVGCFALLMAAMIAFWLLLEWLGDLFL